MDYEKKQDVALLRYTAIAPVVTGLGDAYGSNNDYYREISEKGVTGPDGKVYHFHPDTLQRWYSAYKKQGFEALMPRDRRDAGKSRKIDADLLEQLTYFVEHYPRMPATEILRKLEENGSVTDGQVSLSTITRCVSNIRRSAGASPNRDMRRYERPHINEVWCGDSSVGPRLKGPDGRKQRVYIIALIDDASRFITGADLFFNDNFVNLMSVMRSAVAKYGRPKVWRFDNGRTYRNRQMDLLSARIGTTLSYCQPYTPQGKSKIERWFLTLKDHWYASLDLTEFRSLDELRGSFQEWVRKYNQTPHSSLRGKTPQERFFSEPEQIRRLPDQDLDRSFLLEADRRVSADSVIVIDHVEYEVDCRYAKQKLRIRYSPDMKEVYIVEQDGTLTPVRLLNKVENASVKREKFMLCRGEE
jgi:transposase InsO family protein